MAAGQYEFGAYRLDAQSRMLFKDGDYVPLPAKVGELSSSSLASLLSGVCGPMRNSASW
jgi:hypothetical protein